MTLVDGGIGNLVVAAIRRGGGRTNWRRGKKALEVKREAVGRRVGEIFPDDQMAVYE